MPHYTHYTLLHTFLFSVTWSTLHLDQYYHTPPWSTLSHSTLINIHVFAPWYIPSHSHYNHTLTHITLIPSSALPLIPFSNPSVYSYLDTHNHASSHRYTHHNFIFQYMTLLHWSRPHTRCTSLLSCVFSILWYPYHISWHIHTIASLCFDKTPNLITLSSGRRRKCS